MRRATVALRALIASSLVVAWAVTASAGPINLIGGTAGTVPSGVAPNDYIPGLFPGPQIGGYYGSQIEFDFDVPSVATFEFFGAEAGFTNEFRLGVSVVFTHPGGTAIAPNLGAPLDSESTGPAVGTSLVPFIFTVNSGAGAVANGANPDDSGGLALGPNFFASCDPFGTAAGSGGTSCSTVYLFLDDGGAGPDDDHDDFLVRVTVTPTTVPEPGSMALVAVGLAALRVLRRRA